MTPYRISTCWARRSTRRWPNSSNSRGQRNEHMSDELPYVEGIAHRWVDAAGLRVHVAEAGDGPPLVLLHGWPQHWYAWRHVIPLLSPHYRVICPDLRGFGWTDAPAGGYDKE